MIRIASGSTFRWRPRPPATPPIRLSVVERVRRRGGLVGCGIVGWVSVMAVNLEHAGAAHHWESP